MSNEMVAPNGNSSYQWSHLLRYNCIDIGIKSKFKTKSNYVKNLLFQQGDTPELTDNEDRSTSSQDREKQLKQRIRSKTSISTTDVYKISM